MDEIFGFANFLDTLDFVWELPIPVSPASYPDNSPVSGKNSTEFTSLHHTFQKKIII